MSEVLGALVDAGRRIADAARQHGDDVEVFLVRHDAYPIAVHDDEIRPEMRVGRVQVGMRLIRDGQMTLASTAGLDPEENLDALRTALAVGKPSGVPSFSAAHVPLQDGIDISLQPYVQDPALVQDLARAIRRRFREAPKAALIGSFDAGCELRLVYRAVVTTRGEGGGARGGLLSHADLDSNQHDVVYRPVIDEAAVHALQHVGVRLLEDYPDRDVTPSELGMRGGRIRALLAPRLGEGILRTVLQEKLIATTLANGNTHLRQGLPIFGAQFTLDSLGDDPHLLNCGPCDDEGTPTRRTRVIEGGVFQSFLSSRRSARRTGLQETGNGMRTPIFDEDMSEALIRDRIAGMEMAPGTRSMEELVASMERGVVLFSLLGLHSADKARAQFSTTARGGYAVKEGKVIGRLAPGHWSISSRLFDGPPGRSIFADVEPSRERVLTSTGRMPWLLAHVDVA